MACSILIYNFVLPQQTMNFNKHHIPFLKIYVYGCYDFFSAGVYIFKDFDQNSKSFINDNLITMVERLHDS